MQNPERTGPWGVPILALAGLCLTYILIGKLGLRLAFAFPSATPVWPATALALVATLLLGYRVWPAIFIGAFIVNVTTAGTVATSFGIAAGNTLEAMVGACLVLRFAGGRHCLNRAEGVFKFTLFAALLSTMVSASFGTATLALAGLVPREELSSVWMTWWLGDASGNLLVAPVLLAWLTIPFGPWRWDRGLESLALLLGLFLVGFGLFGGLPELGIGGRQLRFLCIPFLTWAAVRFGPREASTSIFILGAIAVWGLAHQDTSFGAPGTNATLLMLQTYMVVAAVMTLILAAAVTERKAAEAQLLALSIRDPLTGIANYRHLMSSLEGELERSERTGRPFAVLFMDVDGLKQINDRHGHITGSRALTRVAEVLRDSARVVDTAARYGGDEFALLLPETGEEEAAQVARRLAERLAASPESPSVHLSIGIALHPRDGSTPDALIGAADRQLYALRARVRGEHSPNIRSAPQA
jgi:diguanylate cyclase (GGDEF)-like protein